METTLFLNTLLQFHHPLLITSGILRIGVELPLKEFIGVVGSVVFRQNAKSLAIVCDFVPVTGYILHILAEVGETALEDFTVEGSAHGWFEIDVFLVSLSGGSEDVVCSFLAGAEESADFVWVVGDEGFIADIQDGAEAAAAQLGEFVDAQHLNIITRTVVVGEPFGEFDHLDVLETDAGVDVAFDDGFGDVHAAAHGGVVGGFHAVVGSQLVNLDLAEFADITDALTHEGAEVGGDAGGLEVHDTGEGLVEKGSDGLDGKAASFASEGVDHGLEAKVNFAATDDFGDILSRMVSGSDIVAHEG